MSQIRFLKITALTITAALMSPLSSEAATALQCGAVVDTKNAKLLDAHTIVVEGNKITAISAGKNNGPDGAAVVDLSTHTCMPGLVDMHVHITSESSPAAYSEGFRLDPQDYAYRSVRYAERTLMAGFTSVRDLGGSARLNISIRNAIEQETIVGPRVYTAGKSIATTGGHADPTNGINQSLASALGYPGPEDGVVSGNDEARSAVRQRYKEGADLIKITATGGVLSYAKSADNPQFTIEEIQAIVATAKDYGFHVAAHAHGKEGMRRAIIGGVTTIEHGTYADAEIFALMKKHGTYMVPTITAGDFVSKQAKIDGYYPEVIRPKAIRVGVLIAKTFADAYKAGVPFAFGTDSGVSPHGGNAEEFRLMHEAGVPVLEAIRSATFTPAQILGNSDQFGSLEAGKFADIVAVPGNPVSDVALMKNVSLVMKNGKLYKQP